MDGGNYSTQKRKKNLPRGEVFLCTGNLESGLGKESQSNDVWITHEVLGCVGDCIALSAELITVIGVGEFTNQAHHL